MSVETVGYIGLNHHHCEPYLATLETLPVEVTCACEPDPTFDPESVVGLGDVPVYDDPETLLAEEDVDAVVVSLSNRETPGVIELAVDAGIHVYTEKPVARTAAELEPLIECVADADVTVGVSYTWQGHPITEQLNELLETGFYGDLRAFEARFMASKLDYRDTSHFIFDADASRGGILQWLGIHWIQLLTWFLEEPIVRVNARTSHGTPGVSVEDGAAVQLESASGALGTLQCGYYLGEELYDTQLNLYGTRGRSIWDPMGREFGFDGETTVELDSFGDEWGSTPHRTIVHDYDPAPGYGGRPGREFMESFFDACESGDESPVGLDAALDVLKILDAAYESAETNEWVAVE